MNPSASGWIKKLLKEITPNATLLKYNEASFYKALRATGFIFGSNLSSINNLIESKDLSEDELCKVNLVIAFLFTHHNSNSKIIFTESVIAFYRSINEYKTSFFGDLLGSKITSEQLEKLIHKRIHIRRY